MMHKPLVKDHMVVNGTIMVHFKISIFIFIYLTMVLKESITLTLSCSNTCALKLQHGFYKQHNFDVMLLFELIFSYLSLIIYLLSHTSKHLYVPKSSLRNLTLMPWMHLMKKPWMVLSSKRERCTAFTLQYIPFDSSLSDYIQIQLHA